MTMEDRTHRPAGARPYRVGETPPPPPPPWTLSPPPPPRPQRRPLFVNANAVPMLIGVALLMLVLTPIFIVLFWAGS